MYLIVTKQGADQYQGLKLVLENSPNPADRLDRRTYAEYLLLDYISKMQPVSAHDFMDELEDIVEGIGLNVYRGLLTKGYLNIVDNP